MLPKAAISTSSGASGSGNDALMTHFKINVATTTVASENSQTNTNTEVQDGGGRDQTQTNHYASGYDIVTDNFTTSIGILGADFEYPDNTQTSGNNNYNYNYNGGNTSVSYNHSYDTVKSPNTSRRRSGVHKKYGNKRRSRTSHTRHSKRNNDNKKVASGGGGGAGSKSHESKDRKHCSSTNYFGNPNRKLKVNTKKHHNGGRIKKHVKKTSQTPIQIFP